MSDYNMRERENNWIMSLDVEWNIIIWFQLCWVPAVLILCFGVLNVGQWKHPVKIWLTFCRFPAHLQIRQRIQLAHCQREKKTVPELPPVCSHSTLSSCTWPAALGRIWCKEASVFPPSFLLSWSIKGIKEVFGQVRDTKHKGVQVPEEHISSPAQIKLPAVQQEPPSQLYRI